MTKNSKGFAHIFLLIVIVLVGIVGVGYYAYKNGQIKNTPSINPLNSPTPVSLNKNEIDNWNLHQSSVGLEFKYPDSINVCDYVNYLYLEHDHKSLCQISDTGSTKLLAKQELDLVIQDFKTGLNNEFTERELAIEYDGDKNRIYFFNEILNKDKSNILAWFKLQEKYFYIVISSPSGDISSTFDQILSTFEFTNSTTQTIIGKDCVPTYKVVSTSELSAHQNFSTECFKQPSENDCLNVDIYNKAKDDFSEPDRLSDCKWTNK